MTRRAAALALGAAFCLGPTAPSLAQAVGVVQSEIVLIDPERLFEETRLGQAIAQRLQDGRDALIASNRELESALEAEEQALTAQRAQTSPEEFRVLADAFDEKVQQIRRNSERRARDLERNRERAPRDFLRQVEPILADLMRATGAVAILDQRSVLLSADIVDITDLAIARIDAAFSASEPQDPEADP
ncbi:MAG: OmpH family outer membrane protein [Pseudomonadota bacterium]